MTLSVLPCRPELSRFKVHPFDRSWSSQIQDFILCSCFCPEFDSSITCLTDLAIFLNPLVPPLTVCLTEEHPTPLIAEAPVSDSSSRCILVHPWIFSCRNIYTAICIAPFEIVNWRLNYLSAFKNVVL